MIESRRKAAEILLLATVYVAFAKFCQFAALPPGNVCPVWVPSGVALAAVLIRGYWIWPGIFLGTLIGNVSAYFDPSSFHVAATAIFAGLSSSVGNSIGAVTAAYWIQRLCASDYPFLKAREVVIFVLVGGLANAGVSVLFGIGGLYAFNLIQHESLATASITWFTGNTVGTLVITPLILVFSGHVSLPKTDWRSVAFTVVILSICVMGTGLLTNDPIKTVLFALVPVLVWSAFRFDQRTTMLALLMITLVALGLATDFGRSSASISALVEVQLFIGLIAITLLLTQGLVYERMEVEAKLKAIQVNLNDQVKLRSRDLDDALGSLKDSEAHYKETMAFSKTGSWMWDIKSNGLFWSDNVTSILGIAGTSFQLSADSFESLVHPADRELWHVSLRHCVKEGRTLDLTARILPPKGEARWVQIFGDAHRNEEGCAEYLRGLLRDVTSERRAESKLRSALDELQLAVDTAKLGIWRLDLVTGKVDWNDQILAIHGITREEFNKNVEAWRERVHPDDLADTDSRLKDLMAGKVVNEVIFRLKASDTGEWRTIRASGAPIFNEKGQVSELIGVNYDITTLVEREQKLAEAASVFENTIEGVMITNLDAEITRINKAFEQMTGYSAEDVLGENARILRSGAHDEGFYREMWQQLLQEGRWRGEIINRRKDGSLYTELLTISVARNEQGAAIGYVSVGSDITHIKDSELRLRHIAHHDPLTDLPNRLLFDERLKQSIKRAHRESTKLALLFVDIDHFKDINDSLGHAAGDAVLLCVADGFRKALREVDTVARISGDEFVILFDDIHTRDDVIVLIDKLMAVIKTPFQYQGQEIRVTTSAGVAFYPEDADSPSHLLRCADAAMYRAKEGGRNTYSFYTPDLSSASRDHVMLLNALRKSVENRDFSLAFQPQFDLEDSKVCGVEVLLRWEHGTMGPVSPSVFIPVAEESGMMRELGFWVLTEACKVAKALVDDNLEFGRFAVNISGPQIFDADFVKKVEKALSISGLRSRYLELEITENFVMRRTQDAIERLQQIRELGIAIAIDDFGAGYSSLTYIKRLPIDKLKIDQSFIRDIPEDENDMAITDAIISMGRALDLRVIAEGVESQAQVEFLREKHCYEVQGFFFSDPLSLEDLKRILAESDRPADRLANKKPH